MTEFLWFLVGFFLGSIVTTLILCCFQINRLNERRAVIHNQQSEQQNQ